MAYTSEENKNWPMLKLSQGAKLLITHHIEITALAARETTAPVTDRKEEALVTNTHARTRAHTRTVAHTKIYSNWERKRLFLATAKATGEETGNTCASFHFK